MLAVGPFSSSLDRVVRKKQVGVLVGDCHCLVVGEQANVSVQYVLLVLKDPLGWIVFLISSCDQRDNTLRSE